MSRTRIAIVALATMMTSTIALAAPAHASPIALSGDTNWSITSHLTVSNNYPKLGTTVTAWETLVYLAHFVGFPLPVTGYYTLSFPYAPFARPTLLSADAGLDSNTFAYAYDPYMGKNAWLVKGQANFWGSKTVHLNGSAKTDTRGATGYVHGGTGTGHPIDANSIQYISVG